MDDGNTTEIDGEEYYADSTILLKLDPPYMYIKRKQGGWVPFLVHPDDAEKAAVGGPVGRVRELNWESTGILGLPALIEGIPMLLEEILRHRHQKPSAPSMN